MYNERVQESKNKKKILDGLSHKETVYEEQFFIDFQHYYKEIQSSCKQTKAVIKVCQDLYEKATLPFVKKWTSKLPFIKLTPTYSNWPYYSFEIHLQDRIILVPHRIVVYEIVNSNSLFLNQLERIEKINEFKFLLDRFFKNLNVKLNNNDIKILRGLTSKSFCTQSTHIPSSEKMASLFGCSRQTFVRRFDLLKTALSVIYLNYRIDIGKLGYETFFSLLDEKEFERKLKNNKKFCLAKIPMIDIVQNKSYNLLISQIPLHKSEIYQNFAKACDNIIFEKISSSYIGWNLSAIHPSPAQRWSVLPPILSTQNWGDKIISANNGINYNLMPQEYYPKLSSTELKLLSYFEKYGFVRDKKLAETFKVSLDTIKDAWESVCEKKLIHRFTFLSNIGLDFKPWITILGDTERSTLELMSNIVEHLKFFPFSYIFFQTDKNESNFRSLITGLLHMPSTWANDFFYKFSLLTELRLGVQVNLGHKRIVKQNINLMKTY
ncbi:MAG: hypothetical protein ACTSW1_05975 [Candidatus Hodarchaeales archaeon]